MELTPELLETQQFPEKWRGYDQVAVDDFLERVGVAVGELQDRLRKATELLDNKPADAPAYDEDAEATRVSRALVRAEHIAEETIDEATKEAEALRTEATTSAESMKAEAKRLLDDAEGELARREETLLAEARQSAAETTSSAEEEAEAALASARTEAGDVRAAAKAEASEVRAAAAAEASEVRESASSEAASVRANATAEAEAAVREQEAEFKEAIGDLEGRRTQLRFEVGTLEERIHEQRGRLRLALDELQAMLDTDGPLAPSGLIEQDEEPEQDERDDKDKEIDDLVDLVRSVPPPSDKTAPIDRIDDLDEVAEAAAARGDFDDGASETAKVPHPAPAVTAVVPDRGPELLDDSPAAEVHSRSANDDPFLAALRGDDTAAEYDDDGESPFDQDLTGEARRGLFRRRRD